MGLITITEANSSLPAEVYPDWDAIPDDPIKQHHIDRASSYVRLSWTPPGDDDDFDWDDDTTWDDAAAIKDNIAKYADAVRAGIIYPIGATGQASTAPIKRQTEKVGSLEITTEYAQSDSGGAQASVRDIDDSMLVLGFTKRAARGSLTRV